MPTLESIDISLVGIAKVLRSGKLSVPRYQRSYSWEEQNIRDLFNDIGTAMRDGEKEYFLGSIVNTSDTFRALPDRRKGCCERLA